MSFENSLLSASSSEDEMQHLNDPKSYSNDKYDYLEPAGADEVRHDLAELELDGNPIYDDDEDNFDYPQTEKQFGEVVVVMRHIQKCTTCKSFLQLF